MVVKIMAIITMVAMIMMSITRGATYFLVLTAVATHSGTRSGELAVQ